MKVHEIERPDARLELLVWGELDDEAGVLDSRDRMLLLPGLGAEAGSFEPIAPALAAAGFLVAALQPRGIGQVAARLDGLTLHDLAADAAAAIEQLGGTAAWVIGHAFGNRVARCLAADRAERVLGLVLLAAGGRYAAEPEAWADLHRLADADLTVEERLGAYRRALLSPSSPAELSELAGRPWPRAVQCQLEAFAATPLGDWWAGGNAPVLVLQGLDDRIAPPENGRSLLEEHPERVRLVELADAGHALLSEHPQRIVDEILTWIGETRRARRKQRSRPRQD